MTIDQLVSCAALDAITRHRGVLPAAKALGVSKTTMYRWIGHSEQLQAAVARMEAARGTGFLQ
jgi:DNA-binding phage protein